MPDLAPGREGGVDARRGSAAGRRPHPRETLDFNLAPIGYLDPSWYEAFDHGPLMRALSFRPASRSWLSRRLLEDANLNAMHWTDFRRPRTRIALLDRESLQRVLLHIGLVLAHDTLRTELDGAAVKRLRRSVGAGALDFAIRSGPLLAPPLDVNLIDGPEEPRLRFMFVGARHALDPQAATAPAYRARLAWKLPAVLAEPLAAPSWPQAGDPKGGSVPRLVGRLIKELAPEWLPLFD